MQKLIKILPCPFCGCEAEIESDDAECRPLSYRIRCLNHDWHALDWWEDTPEEAISVWNKRVGDGEID